MNLVRIRLQMFFSVGLLAALAIPFLYINFLSPIVSDTWGIVAIAARFDSVFDPFDAYGNTYWNGNPRLGQLFLIIGGVSTPARVLVNFVSLSALTIAAFTIITGRLFRPYVINDVITAALFISALLLVHQEIGVQFFYTPYTTNYVLGYAVLLTFLVPYRIAMLQPHFNFERYLLFAMPPLGIMAGLTNEHTPPIYISMISLALLLLPIPTKRWRWMAGGLAGIAFGYALLFFAPGQSKRYGGVKYEAWESAVGKKIAAAEEITRYFAADGRALALLAGFAAAAVILLLLKRGDWREHTEQGDALVIGVLLLIAAIGMAVPLIVSPRILPRLLFASHVNLAMAASAALLAISNAPAWRALLGVLAIGINAAFLWKAYLAYSLYHVQFLERAEIIESQKASRASPVVMPCYTIKFGSLKKYVRKERCNSDPTARLNRWRARYFGVEFAADGGQAPTMRLEPNWAQVETAVSITRIVTRPGRESAVRPISRRPVMNRNLLTNLNVPIDFKRNYFERNLARSSAIP